MPAPVLRPEVDSADRSRVAWGHSMPEGFRRFCGDLMDVMPIGM